MYNGTVLRARISLSGETCVCCINLYYSGENCFSDLKIYSTAFIICILYVLAEMLNLANNTSRKPFFRKFALISIQAIFLEIKEKHQSENM